MSHSTHQRLVQRQAFPDLSASSVIVGFGGSARGGSNWRMRQGWLRWEMSSA